MEAFFLNVEKEINQLCVESVTREEALEMYLYRRNTPDDVDESKSVASVNNCENNFSADISVEDSESDSTCEERAKRHEEPVVLNRKRTLKGLFEFKLEMFLRHIKYDRSISQLELIMNLWKRFSA